MKELKRDLLTSKYTRVFVGPVREGDTAPREYLIEPSETEEGGANWGQMLWFQSGPILEEGVNGICNEDLLNIVCDRLEHFQRTEFACRENALALTAIEEALLWLRKRNIGREQRGVEGTREV